MGTGAKEKLFCFSIFCPKVPTDAGFQVGKIIPILYHIDFIVFFIDKKY